METEKVVPTELELKGFDLNDPNIVELIHQAQESATADQLLTIRQALKKYRKAVFWAMFLSTSLIMEGYDLVIVRTNSFFIHLRWRPSTYADTPIIDYFILRSDSISKPFWGLQRC
jgi:hypothetical protein